MLESSLERELPRKTYVIQTYGVEIELLAPIGSSRKAFCETLAKQVNGVMRPFFHIDTEPSKVKGKPVFFHLTQGFEVLSKQGESIVQCVDDITLQHDLDKSRPPIPGWYRILSDDLRLLRLIQKHSHADDPIEVVLNRVGSLFDAMPERSKGGVYRLADESGSSIALAAPLPGERERACELVTPPLTCDDTDALKRLLAVSSQMQFTLPEEGATHIHFDGQFFCNASILKKTINFLHAHRLILRHLLAANPHCSRLGDWSSDLLDVVNQTGFEAKSWEQVLETLKPLRLSKYCDFNIRNLIHAVPDKHTLEVRILPATQDANQILAAVDLFQRIFFHLQCTNTIPRQNTLTPDEMNVRAFTDQFALSVE
jgi:hypothetical protein